MGELQIRVLEAKDNAEIAIVIRSTLMEFGAARPGTVYYDEATDRLSEVFNVPRGTYYVVEENNVILGGAGIYPTEGLGDAICELVKMYLLPEARGKGLGKVLMNKCIDFAVANDYQQIYLETMPELSNAITLYEKFDFKRLDGPLGRTGHFGCGIWMLRDISA
ncbi:MAG: family N-acetyltransferase [Bacteroidetes bacterium]|nr:family N-acetyltransferase [Bacteroidota bacterium]